MIEPTSHKPMLLLVDDTPINLQILALGLRQEYLIQIATSGAAALEQMRRADKPDLVLLDVMMPEMDGYELLRQMKADPTLQAIPVIFVTAKSDPQSESHGLELGAADYLSKPIQIEQAQLRIRNLLERERLRQELAQHRDHLEALVAARTEALSLAKEAAETASRGKSTFLTNMSHELRTPMHGILGMVSLAKRRATDPKQVSQLEKAEISAKRLLTLLDDLLDIARIEADKLTLARIPFRLREVIDSVQQVAEVLAQKKELLFQIEVDEGVAEPVWLGDPVRLGQILLNLVGNAIKFTDHGWVQIRISTVTQYHNRIYFEVEDTGIGIDPADLHRIFNPFEQADGSVTRAQGGTGIGLALCKQLVTMMGGEIGLTTQIGSGSTFWFTVQLPTLDETAPPAAATRSPEGELSTLDQRLEAEFSGAKVLLVEDDEIAMEMMQAALESVGLTVYRAHDGVEALQLAHKQHLDLILMDLMLPRMGGIEATYAIRALPNQSRVPILAITAQVFAKDKEATIRAGMNAHIAKPIGYDRLLEVVWEWLNYSRTAAPAES